MLYTPLHTVITMTVHNTLTMQNLMILVRNIAKEWEPMDVEWKQAMSHTLKHILDMSAPAQVAMCGMQHIVKVRLCMKHDL